MHSFQPSSRQNAFSCMEAPSTRITTTFEQGACCLLCPWFCRSQPGGLFKQSWITRSVSSGNKFVFEVEFDTVSGKRRTRAFIGLAVVGIPLIAAWIWEIVRVRNYDRANPPTRAMDWTDDGFVAIFFLFMMNWIFSSLWQYIILYFLGTLTNSPRKSANYAVSVFRSWDEVVCKTNMLRVYSVASWVQEKRSALVSTLSPCPT